jgi:disulfide bond formation protein DsbB
MKCNVGGMDMVARLVGGVILLIIGFFVPMNIALQVVVFVVAAIALVTGIVHYCPANALLGLNTCARQQQESHTEMKGVK